MLRHCLTPNFPIPQHHILKRSQPFYPDRSTRVKFVGADADFSAQAKLEAIGKAGAGVDHHAG